jgi:hypothetical protein
LVGIYELIDGILEFWEPRFLGQMS